MAAYYPPDRLNANDEHDYDCDRAAFYFVYFQNTKEGSKNSKVSIFSFRSILIIKLQLCPFKRKLLLTTDTELNAIAALQSSSSFVCIIALVNSTLCFHDSLNLVKPFINDQSTMFALHAC